MHPTSLKVQAGKWTSRAGLIILMEMILQDIKGSEETRN